MSDDSKGSVRSTWTGQREASRVSEEIAQQLEGMRPTALMFFCSHQHDGAAISASLKSRFPSAQVIGCTTAGEFANQGQGVEGVSAMAFDAATVRRSSAALASCADGTAQGVSKAVANLAREMGVGSLRDLDPKRYVGVVLVEGLKMREEEVNEQLGNHAPLLSFVGGSAGDNLAFKETRVFVNAESNNDGAALLLMESATAFTVAKTCSFEPMKHSWKATRVDEKTRTIFELDGKPVAEVYAAALGLGADKLDGSVFMSHPLGLMIDGKPWIRSPQQLLPDGSLRFYCKVQKGMQLHLMASTDMIADMRQAIANTASVLGARPSGMVVFNCILRRLELDAKALHGQFLESFNGIQTAGFHTYGESWLGHINQTFTALAFA